MPHPEHAIDPLTGPSADGLRMFRLGARGGGAGMTTTTARRHRRGTRPPRRTSPQPYRELGLKDDEYARIREILGRRPTDAELAMYSVMWSEHCSYKSSKVHLRYFGETTTEEMRASMLAGIGENAGVVDIGDGWAVTFKVESHNHPSYVEPYQGAATGVGGIVRDILAMGARPLAVMDPLRFGAADAPDTRRVLPGVVAGVGGYGNCLGLPNIGGEVVFDPSYQGNPLVNALCVGAMRVEDLHLAHASGHRQQGHPVRRADRARRHRRRVGAGVGHVRLATTARRGRKKLPSVQVGDPFTEKVLIECCLELFARGHRRRHPGPRRRRACRARRRSWRPRVTAACTSYLERVPLRAKGMTPAEILSSESQERMCAVVRPADVDAFMRVCAKWDVIATEIGEVTDGDRLVITWHGETVVDVPPRTVAHEGPVYSRPGRAPGRPRTRWSRTSPAAPGHGRTDLRAEILRMAGSPNLASRRWVTEQYDRYVRGGTVLAQPADAGMIRIDEATGRGVAISCDCNGRFVRLDPYAGTQLALAEAYRNVAASGARPVAVTNCLNFGSPEDPGVMWQFEQAVRGLADGCAALGIPVTGGNVSFYNQTGSTAILPTPVVGVLGVIDDVRHPHPDRPRRARATRCCCSARPATSSAARSGRTSRTATWAAGRPAVDLDRERAIGSVLRTGDVSAAHDLSEGGLAQALVEACLLTGHGCRRGARPAIRSWRCSASRRRGCWCRFRPPAVGRVRVPAARDLGLPWTRLGTVTPADALGIEGLAPLPLAELGAVWEGTLPALFG